MRITGQRDACNIYIYILSSTTGGTYATQTINDLLEVISTVIDSKTRATAQMADHV